MFYQPRISREIKAAWLASLEKKRAQRHGQKCPGPQPLSNNQGQSQAQGFKSVPWYLRRHQLAKSCEQSALWFISDQPPWPLILKETNVKGNQPWIFISRTDAEAGAPIPWPPDAKSQLIGKDPDAGKD